MASDDTTDLYRDRITLELQLVRDCQIRRDEF